MIDNQRELASAIRLFANENADRPKHLNVFLERHDLLDRAGSSLSAALDKGNILEALKTINSVLRAFGQAPRTGTLAEDMNSLNRILLAGMQIERKATHARKSEAEADVRKELRGLEIQITEINNFLRRRRQNIYDLEHFRIGGH